MMFNVSKIALAVAATLAATSALATTALPNTTTGGELTLVVFDATTSQAYARGLGVTMSQLVTEGDTGSNKSTQTGPETLAVSAAVSAALNKAPDANLTAFLATTGAKTYMVVADWNQGTGLANGGTAANYLSTTTKNLYNGGTYVTGATTNSDSLGFNTFPSAANSINAAITQSNVGNAALDGKSVGSSKWGAAYAGVTGTQNLATWFQTGFGVTGTASSAAAAGTGTPDTDEVNDSWPVDALKFSVPR
jgi:hypothetical protein